MTAVATVTPASRPERGFTLFELAVVFCVAAVLGGVLLDRLNFYQALAERAAMDAQLSIFRTGLQIRLAELIIANRQAEAALLEREDFAQWPDTRPANYAGEYHEPPQPGNWYFDTQRRQLVYVVNAARRLESGSAELRFQARLLRGAMRVGDVMVDTVTGVTLKRVEEHGSLRTDAAVHWA